MKQMRSKRKARKRNCKKELIPPKYFLNSFQNYYTSVFIGF